MVTQNYGKLISLITPEIKKFKFLEKLKATKSQSTILFSPEVRVAHSPKLGVLTHT